MRRPDDAVLDEADIARLSRDRELGAGYREAARRALAFARRYRGEEGSPGGVRERACVAQAQAWRHLAHDLGARSPVSTRSDGAGPGLARTRSEDAAASTADDTRNGRQTG